MTYRPPPPFKYNPPAVPGESWLAGLMIFAGLGLAALIAWPLIALFDVDVTYAYPVGLLIIWGSVWGLVRWRKC